METQHDLAVRCTVARRVRQGHRGERTLGPSPAHELGVRPQRERQPLARQLVEGVRASPGIEHEASEHRVERHARELHYCPAQDTPDVLEVVYRVRDEWMGE